MSEDQGTPEERPKPPPPPPPRMATPPPPKHAAAPAAAEETPPREPDPAPEPTPDPTPDPAPAPMPEPAPEAAGPAQTAAVETPEKPKQKASTAKKRSAGSLVRSLIWIVVLALIAWGIYAYIHHKNSSDDNAPTRTVVVLPKQLLGADRVVSPADRKLRKELNTHLFKQDAKAQVADYVATVDGRKQVTHAIQFHCFVRCRTPYAEDGQDYVDDLLDQVRDHIHADRTCGSGGFEVGGFQVGEGESPKFSWHLEQGNTSEDVTDFYLLISTDAVEIVAA